MTAIPAIIFLTQNCAKTESTTTVIAPTTTDCSYELACTDPTGAGGNDICISGRIVDSVDRTANLSASVLSAIELRLYDALTFVSNPTGAAPIKTLTAAAGNIDSCGRYTTTINVSTDTPFGFVGLVVTDLTGAGSNYVLSSSVRRTSAYQNLVGARSYLVSTSQDQAWSTAAGVSGTTFATSGAIAVRYYQGGNANDPIPGVAIAGITPTWNGSSIGSIDYFFNDTGLKTMQTIDSSLNVTGANGVTFLLPPPGFGNVSAGSSCTKLDGTAGTTTAPSDSYAAAAGVILFADLGVTCN